MCISTTDIITGRSPPWFDWFLRRIANFVSLDVEVSYIVLLGYFVALLVRGGGRSSNRSLSYDSVIISREPDRVSRQRHRLPIIATESFSGGLCFYAISRVQVLLL